MGKGKKWGRKNDDDNVIIQGGNVDSSHVRGGDTTVFKGKVRGPIHRGSGEQVNGPRHYGKGNTYNYDD
jgi:hypothetical protein